MDNSIYSKLKFIYRAFRYRHHVDKGEISYILNNIKSGDIVADIGAHKGGYLYWLQKKIGKQGRCYAFEPQPKLFEYLVKINDMMDYKNIIYENMGLSSEQGTSQIYIPINSETSPSATLNTKNEDFTSYNIKTDTLDSYFYDNRIQLSFLKIDVEGHELEVLKGGENLIKQNSMAILMECEERHLKNHTVFDVFSFLSNHGFEGYFFFNNKLVSIKDFDLQTHQNLESNLPYCNNFLFRK